MLSAPGEHSRRTHAHKFMPRFRIPIFLCAVQHRAFQRNNALYPTPNNAEPEPMHIHPQCPVPYLVILYSVQSPCFVLFLAQKTGGMAAQIRRCTRAVLGVSISIFKAKYSTKKRCYGHPPRIIQLGRLSYSSLLRQKRKLVNPPRI